VPANVAAALPPLDPTEVASILREDPFFASSTLSSATLRADPRFRSLGNVEWDSALGAQPSCSTTWGCGGALDDLNFEVLDAVEFPFGHGETLVVQRGSLAVDPACPPQTPGLTYGSTTPGCGFLANLLVDTVFGTLLLEPQLVASACSAAP
jgi:hypothetical protein